MGSPVELKMRPGELTRVPKSPMHFLGSSLSVCGGFEAPRHSGRSLGPVSLQRTRLQAQIIVRDALHSRHSLVPGMPREKMHVRGRGGRGGGVGSVGLDPGRWCRHSRGLCTAQYESAKKPTWAVHQSTMLRLVSRATPGSTLHPALRIVYKCFFFGRHRVCQAEKLQDKITLSWRSPHKRPLALSNPGC